MTHFLVCATQRSGSTLVCGLLAQTGVAGVPRESLLLWLENRHRTGEGFWLEALQKTIDLGSTPNGVFGCKVMANHFEAAMDLLRAIPQARDLTAWEVANLAFDGPKVVRVRRRNRLRQAISTHIARITRVLPRGASGGCARPVPGRGVEGPTT